jgi:type I restriction enzyme, S subunit
MKLREKRLGDVVTLQRGHDLPEASRKEGPVPVVSSSGITGYHNIAKAQPPGVVTGRYGTLGEVFYVEEPYWPLNTALYAIDFHGNNPRFISYFLKQVLRRTRSDKAAVPGVNRNDLHEIQVRIPDADIQGRIADIAATYDDLIENNLRRIRLLEEAARLLYREWFVLFRFHRGSVSPARLSRLLHEFKALSLWNQNAEPWKSFVPLLVTKFTTDPAARPYSAENWFVISRNS